MFEISANDVNSFSFKMNEVAFSVAGADKIIMQIDINFANLFSQYVAEKESVKKKVFA